MIYLEVYRYYIPHTTVHSTLGEAISAALADADSGEGFPTLITDDMVILWERKAGLTIWDYAEKVHQQEMTYAKEKSRTHNCAEGID